MSTLETNERISDVIFESLNRMHDAKKSGVLGHDELSKLLKIVGDVFATQVRNGKTEEDVENFEKEIPNGKYNYFNYNHTGLSEAYETIRQSNTAALLDRENRYSRMKRR